MIRPLTQSAFARHIGKSRQYVSNLKQTGRLALDEKGRVLVAESLALIEQTTGGRDDVAQRNAEKRARKTEGSATGRDDEHQETLKTAQRLKLLAESRRVQAVADREEMERDRIAGNLIPREEVEAAFRFIGAQLRAMADVYPDQTAPLVAPVSDIHEVHQILSESRRNELQQLGQAIEKQRSELHAAKG